MFRAYQKWKRKFSLDRDRFDNLVGQEPLFFPELIESLEDDMLPAATLLPYWGTMQGFNRDLINARTLDFINYSLRGIGQVVFVNNPISGLLILFALFVQSPWLGSMSLLGVITSTVTAIIWNLERSNIRNGIYGYNGTLVGAAIATFGFGGNSSGHIIWVVAVMIFSALTTILFKLAGNWWVKTFKSPPLTLPFNIMTLIFLGWAQYIPEFAFGQPKPSLDPANSLDFARLIGAVFVGFGQIFLADKLIVGVLIFLAIALCTPIGAMVGLAGSIVGLITGIILGAGVKDLYSGLYCYNSILGAMAIGGIFYVFNRRSFWLALGCACLSVFVGEALVIFLGIFNFPSLTLPFCIATIFLFVVLKEISFLVPVSLHAITNPEEHRQRYSDVRLAVYYFRFQLERFMLGQPNLFWYNLAEVKVKTNLRYIFEAIDVNRVDRVSCHQIKIYLHETGQLFSDENIDYLTKFIDLKDRGAFSYEQFSEFILRHEYLIVQHQLLLDYFLPLDKNKDDLISDSEIKSAIASSGYVSLTRMQVRALQARTKTNWTWNQFIKIILAI